MTQPEYFYGDFMTLPKDSVALGGEGFPEIINLEHMAEILAGELAKSFDVCPKDDDEGNELAPPAEVAKVVQSLLTNYFFTAVNESFIN